MAEKKTRCFEITNKPDIHMILQEKGYEIKYEKDRPKSKKLYKSIF